MPNKPTTLREEFDNKFELTRHGIVEKRPSYLGNNYHDDFNIVADWWLDKFSTHSTELLSKIEGLRLEIDPLSVNKRGHHTNGAHRKIRYNRALDDVIKLINQE